MSTDSRNIPFDRDALLNQIPRITADAVVGTMQLAESAEVGPDGKPLAKVLLLTGPMAEIAMPLLQKLYEAQLDVISAAQRDGQL